MSETLATIRPNALAMREELGVEDVIAQVQKIQAVMERVMKEGEHYGVIPGTQKPTLLKPGAEKLLLTFRFDPQYESTETYDGKHLTIKSRCTLYHITSGQRLGSGEGSCSTKESKYAYRQGMRLCPKCGKDAIIKGKKEYGGGWLCFNKKGGCGEKWKDGDTAIEGQSTARVANDDLADQYNTVLKMANKRSLVAVVLNVTAASDIFTQDMEDMPHGGEVIRANAASVGAETQARPTPSTDPEDHRAESETLFPKPEDDERKALLDKIQAAGAGLTKAQRGRLKETFLGDAEADVNKADISSLRALVTHIEAVK